MKIVKNKNNRGGVRLGAGRKSGSGLYGEETKVIRVPRSSLGNIKKYLNLSRINNIDEISLALKETPITPLSYLNIKYLLDFLHLQMITSKSV